MSVGLGGGGLRLKGSKEEEEAEEVLEGGLGPTRGGDSGAGTGGASGG